MPDRTALEQSYDTLAPEYAAHLWDELQKKPLDRALLDVFAEEVKGRGLVVDLGTGPGQVARYLKDRGVEASGVDLSQGMIDVAARLSPDIPFRKADLLALDVWDGAWAGATAFYSIVHFEPDELSRALTEIARALAPGAPLLLAFHVGDERLHLDSLWNKPIDATWIFHERAFVERALEHARLGVEMSLERVPYPDEHPSRRAYVLARKVR